MGCVCGVAQAVEKLEVVHWTSDTGERDVQGGGVWWYERNSRKERYSNGEWLAFVCYISRRLEDTLSRLATVPIQRANILSSSTIALSVSQSPEL